MFDVCLCSAQEPRDGRDGHGGLEEHDLVAPAPDRRGVPRAGHAAAADPAHRAAAQARQAGLGRASQPAHTKDTRHTPIPCSCAPRIHKAAYIILLDIHRVP